MASSHAFVIVNGSPTKEFSIMKGVCQGDTISPFLFTIVIHRLNIKLCSCSHQSLLHAIIISNSNVYLSHLFYEGDALFVDEWKLNNIKNMARILHCFYVSYVLKVNFHKSKLFRIGVEDIIIFRSVRLLGCDTGIFPFNYLGVPMGANMMLKKN